MRSCAARRARSNSRISPRRPRSSAWSSSISTIPARHPELISLINNENLHRARHLRKSKKVRELHSPFVQLIDDILRRGVAEGVFRRGVDPVDLYITIAAVGYFYFSNNWTLSAIFGRDSAARPHAAGASGTMSNSF